MHVKSEALKAEREAAINQKIEEIRKKNANIHRRYQEIENDKKNAEQFSHEAIERMKDRPAANTEDSEPKKSTIQRKQPKPLVGKIVKKVDNESTLLAVDSTVDYRPQRLSEKDLPPPDPVFSYLTDRLREGAFCSPISPLTQRRKPSTSSQSSEMSVDGKSSGYSSRKTSTCSNSSWTSDASSFSSSSSSNKYCGFANYQPPRKYSACRDYVRNRRMSQEQSIQDDQLVDYHSNDVTDSHVTRPPSSRIRRKTSNYHSVNTELSIIENRDEGIKDTSHRVMAKNNANGSNNVTNWRLRDSFQQNLTDDLASLDLNDQESNNNND